MWKFELGFAVANRQSAVVVARHMFAESVGALEFGLATGASPAGGGGMCHRGPFTRVEGAQETMAVPDEFVHQANAVVCASLGPRKC